MGNNLETEIIKYNLICFFLIILNKFINIKINN